MYSEEMYNLECATLDAESSVLDAMLSLVDKQETFCEFYEGDDLEEFDMFQEAVSKKQQRRYDKFLREHDYDPKTGTIATDIVGKDGKKKRIKFNIADAPDIVGGPAYTQVFPGDPLEDAEITMSKQLLRRKPQISDFILKHEEGHAAYRTGNAGKAFRDDRRSAKKYLKQERGTNEKSTHDMDPEEYAADAYAMKHSKFPMESALRALNALRPLDTSMRKFINSTKKLTLKKLHEQQLDPASLRETYNDQIQMGEDMMKQISDLKNSDPDAYKSMQGDFVLKELKSQISAAKKLLTFSDDELVSEVGKAAISELGKNVNALEAGAKARIKFLQRQVNIQKRGK